MNVATARSPLVTVLLPCYNGARWIEGAISSVLEQTFTNFELIIVDDGSTDDSPKIISKYARSDSRAIVFSKSNTGLDDTLNLGISMARGKWIARIDQDDICHPKRFQEQISFLAYHPEVVLLGTGCHEIDESGRTLKTHSYPNSHFRLLQNLERASKFFPHSSAMYLTEAARMAGGYNVRIRNAADWHFWQDLAVFGHIRCLEKALVYIRKHPEQMSEAKHGRSQKVESIASSICHILRRADPKMDPSLHSSTDDWTRLVLWVEEQCEKSGGFKLTQEKRRLRQELLSSEFRLYSFIKILMRSEMLLVLTSMVLAMILRSSTPRKLARRWRAHVLVKQVC